MTSLGVVPPPSDIKISLEIPIQNISSFVCGASNQSRAGKLLLIEQRKFCSDNEIIAVFLPVPLVKVNVNGSLDFYFHLVLAIGKRRKEAESDERVLIDTELMKHRGARRVFGVNLWSRRLTGEGRRQGDIPSRRWHKNILMKLIPPLFENSFAEH